VTFPWVRSLAALVISMDIVFDVMKLWNDDLTARLRAGAAYDRVIAAFPCHELIKKIKNCRSEYRRDPYKAVQFLCSDSDVLNVPSIAWRHTILRSNDIFHEIDNPLAIVNFNPLQLSSLLNEEYFHDAVESSVIPLARGFFLYSIGEILVDYGEVDLINSWYRIVQAKEPIFMTKMVIPKPNLSDIQIDIPTVLLQIIVSYTKWELRSRADVMRWLLQI